MLGVIRMPRMYGLSMSVANNGRGYVAHNATVLEMQRDKRLREQGRNSMFKDLSDERAVYLLNEFAKVDPKALRLMALLQDAREFGARDMLIGQIYAYLREQAKDD